MSDAELFLQKIYTVAKASADEQLERERELLRQKEIEYQEDMQQAVDMANDATERAELLEEQLEALTNKKSELDAALGKAENSLSLKSAELERSLADIDKLEKRIVELEGKLEAKAADLTRAQDHLEQAKSENRSLSQNWQLQRVSWRSKRQEYRADRKAPGRSGTKNIVERAARKCTGQTGPITGLLATAKAHGESAERECQRLSGEVEKLDAKLSSAEAEARALVQDKGMMAGQLQEKTSRPRASNKDSMMH